MQFDWSPYAIDGATRADSFSGMTPGMRNGLSALLMAADSELGSGLQVYSGYRSPELQGQLYENALAKYGSPEEARKWVAPAGRSRHNSGQAADLKWNGVRLDQAPEHIREWVRSNAHRFGLDVPMSWEPWQVEQAGARTGNPLAAPQVVQQRQSQEPQADRNALTAYRAQPLDVRDFMTPQRQVQLRGFT